jgi:hypothetical protein
VRDLAPMVHGRDHGLASFRPQTAPRAHGFDHRRRHHPFTPQVQVGVGVVVGQGRAGQGKTQQPAFSMLTLLTSPRTRSGS